MIEISSEHDQPSVAPSIKPLDTPGEVDDFSDRSELKLTSESAATLKEIATFLGRDGRPEQMKLYENADILEAFNTFKNNPRVQENFEKLAVPGTNRDELMYMFLTDPYYQEVLQHMMSKKEKGTPIDANYIMKNMLYRSRVWVERKKILYSERTPEDRDQDIKNIDTAVRFLRAKAQIVSTGISENMPVADIGKQLTYILDKPIEEGSEVTYRDILSKPEIVAFLRDTMIGGIRDEEKSDGSYELDEKTKLHTRTSLQLFVHLYGENVDLSFDDMSSQNIKNTIYVLQRLEIGGEKPSNFIDK
jgi:hypothetical protein